MAEQQGAPEILGISLYEYLVLVANTMIAKKHPDIGYLDAETPLSVIYTRMRKEGCQITTKELEALLWGCVMTDEKDQFWHPENDDFQDFLFKLLNSRKVQKAFNPVYCYVTDKAKRGRPKNEKP